LIAGQLTPLLRVSQLVKSFGTPTAATLVLDGIDLCLRPNQVCALVGPSGCGKSTLLNVISGLEEPTTGSVEKTVSLRIGYMMQDALLLPWRTLIQNASLGAEIQNGETHHSCDDLHELFEKVGLKGFENHYPSTASGGMKQRVALVRTLVTRPECALLDEPFSSLDFDVKIRVQRILLDFLRQRRMSALLVTHDIEDAIALSDEIVVLSNRPAKVGATIAVELGIERRDPVEARKSADFPKYFSRIWEEMRQISHE